MSVERKTVEVELRLEGAEALIAAAAAATKSAQAARSAAAQVAAKVDNLTQRLNALGRQAGELGGSRG